MSHFICRLLTDDKLGNVNPALALAEQIKKHIDIEIQPIKLNYHKAIRAIPLQLLFNLPSQFILKKFFGFEYDPNVILSIGNGGMSIVPNLILNRIHKLHSSKALIVQLQNPRISADYFDYVIAPSHDFVRGANVIPTIGSLSRINHLIECDHSPIPIHFSELKTPRIAVLIGGSNGRHTLDHVQAEKIAHDLLSFSIVNKLSLVVTCSRRTGARNEKILRQILCGENIFFPTADMPNPYTIMLKDCEAAIVTCDSVNMISDCIAAGLATYIYHLPGDNGKFEFFYNSLKRRSLVFNFNNQYTPRKIKKFDENARVSQIIIQALKQNYVI